jgi:hypothetical protein
MTTRMLRRLYYVVKPVLPRPVQIAVRRHYALLTRRDHEEVWPRDPRSAVRPRGWRGWPRGRRFALVLTHDVEHTRGARRCLDLARLERELGFVASYHFVPERYPVPPDLRSALAAEGFEIGVHDLRHDGKLYDSREMFLQGADRINRYLREWRAVGFRSASMRHNLDWIRALSIEWDSSTFDTDPFEPQPDGLRTIFPRWVPGTGAAGNGGYVELPYTLAQDHTLFVVLRNPDIRVWKEKLDWLADKGGMALINTHPDYMCCPGARRKIDEYPREHYEEFLRYARGRYRGEYWNALPREVARFWRQRRNELPGPAASGDRAGRAP